MMELSAKKSISLVCDSTVYVEFDNRISKQMEDTQTGSPYPLLRFIIF